MPPWSAHNPSAHQPANPAGVQPPANTSPIRVPFAGGRSPNRSRHADQRPGVTSSAPFLPPPSPPPYNRRGGHSRSLSQPFASAISAATAGVGKRRNKSISVEAALDSDDDDDDDDIYLPKPNAISSSPRKGHGPPRVPPKEDLATGKCMTCNNTVRWPRNLKVFRCTECLTVNDLEPSPETGASRKTGISRKDGKASIPRKGALRSKRMLLVLERTDLPIAIPLTVERTATIIDRCVSSYLQQWIGPPPVPAKDEISDEKSQTVPSWSKHLPIPHRPVAPRGRSLSSSDTREKPLGGSKFPGDSGASRAPLAPIPPPKDAPDLRTAPRHANRERSRPRESGKKEKYPYIFRELEDYIISSFRGCDTLNSSFNSHHVSRKIPESIRPEREPEQSPRNAPLDPVELDAKTLLVGDLAENSSWWMADQESTGPPQSSQPKHKGTKVVSSRSPRINWVDVGRWYQLMLTAGTSWVEKWSSMQPPQVGEANLSRAAKWQTADLSAIEKEVTESRIHLHRTLLKATESLLKRPRRPLKQPDDLRFLLILLANPLIYPPTSAIAGLTVLHGGVRPSRSTESRNGQASNSRPRAGKDLSGGPSHHPGIIKRIVGLLSDLPSECHHYLVSWFSRFPAGQFEKLVELIGRFVTYRLSRQNVRMKNENANGDSYLIPSFSSAAMHTPAELHAAINGINQTKPASKKEDAPMTYKDDWQVRAAGRVMALLFTANNADITRKPAGAFVPVSSSAHGSHRGQIIPTTSFYNTRLDYSNLVVPDFEAWESKTAKFSFCQYPFFLSIGAKIQILEHDARRQMEVKAREAFFNSILGRKAVSQYFVLKVRRECLVDDSLQRVSEALSSTPEEMKKGLRIGFQGEEGVDAGGLRKEWFLLLVREVFDPQHGKSNLRCLTTMPNLRNRPFYIRRRFPVLLFQPILLRVVGAVLLGWSCVGPRHLQLDYS